VESDSKAPPFYSLLSLGKGGGDSYSWIFTSTLVSSQIAEWSMQGSNAYQFLSVWSDPARVFKIAEKAACRSVFLTIWLCILGAELTKNTPSDCLSGNFKHL